MKLPIDKTKKLTEELMDLLGVEAKISLSTQGETLRVSLDSIEEAQQKVLAGAQWIDVRYPSEFQYDQLPGAINIPLSEIRNAFGLLDKDREYVLYCQSERRSSAASAVSRAKATGEGQPLYNLNAGQRRTIHMYLANEKTISTESFGEGKERYLVVKPKK